MEETEKLFAIKPENADHDENILLKDESDHTLEDEFPDIHQLIRIACDKLNSMEKLEIEETVLSESNSSCDDIFENNNHSISENSSDDHIGENLHQSNKSFLHYVLIRRNGIYHCSECFFHSKHYKSFHYHCVKVHAGGRKTLVSEAPSKSMYHCSKCLFATFNVMGFKVHCATRHKRSDYQKLINCIPLSNPEAYSKFKLFIGSIRDAKKRKHALQQSQKVFEKRPIPQTTLGSNRKKKRQITPLVLREAAEDIVCMMCSYKSLFPDEIRVHYQSTHNTDGPLRATLDHLYYCESCSFSNISYKALHHHFRELHHPLLEFTHQHFHNVCNSEDDSELLLEKDECQDVEDGTEDVTSEVPNKVISANCFEKWIKCDRCNFKTTSTCIILNHWKMMHSRFYPPFVMEIIYENFRKNVVEINFPSWMIDTTWMNGWINQGCTYLIQKPFFKCGHCEYTSQLNSTLKTHLGLAHPQTSYSLTRLNVLDSNTNANKFTHRLCRRNILYQCFVCETFTSFFFKDIFVHLISEHDKEVEEVEADELDRKIRSSLISYCSKCKINLCNSEQALMHYQSEHMGSLSTFCIKSHKDSQPELYKCSFCDNVSENLKQLSLHLEMHRSQQLSNFKNQHISGYCCSMCRRVFRHERLYRHHFSRLHIEWNETSLKYSDFPLKFFCKTDNLPQKMSLSADIVQKFVAEPSDNPSTSFSTEQTSDLSKPSCTSLTINKKESGNPDIQEVAYEYVCRSCPFVSDSGSEMCVHVKQKHAQHISMKKIDEMRVAKKSMEVKSDGTKKHRLYHTCSHRRFVERNPELYQKHVDLCHNVKQPNICPLCPHAYVCEVVLRMHMRKKHKSVRHARLITKRYYNTITSTCTHRNIELRSPENFRLHVETKHSAGEPFHCHKCPKIYTCSTMFSNHLRRRHTISATDKMLESCKKLFQKEVNTSKKEKCVFKTIPKKNPQTVSLCVKEAKDYAHRKSVKIPPGQWKCLYCKHLFSSYHLLRKHVIKLHPARQLFRCRWCDFTSRTKVGLTNHSKIHSNFIGSRMKLLREICRKKQINGLQVSSLPSEDSQSKEIPAQDTPMNEAMPPSSPDDEKALQEMRIKESFEKENPTPPRHQRARKSIQPCSHDSEWKKRLRSYDDIMNNDQPFKLTTQGTVRCRFCDFTSADQSRMLFHLKASHVRKRTYKCKLCFFEDDSFEQMETHLDDHHKMKRNHHLVVDMSIKYGPYTGNDVESNQKNECQLRHRPFVPRPSLPVVKPNGYHDNLRDIFDPCRKIQKLALDDSATNGQKQTSFRSRVTRSSSTERFDCKYCEACCLTTFDMELHMKRHEAAMVDTTQVDASSVLFAKFTSFFDHRQ